MKYKVIFIDWFNTLSTSLYWDHWKENGLHDKFAIVQSEIFNNNDDYIKWMKGKHVSEDIIKKVRHKVGISSKQMLQDLEFSSKTLKYIKNDIPRKIFLLKKFGYKVVLATDNMDAFSRWTVPALKLDELFDDILNSYHLGVLKNETAKNKSLFFDDYLKKNKIKKGQSILVDDSLDSKVVEKHGIDFFHIKKGNPEPAFNFLLKK
jgi:FMN phosphatase YigB (HAD superfamily)